MKTTMMFRNIANPRRTTLAHVNSTEGEGAVVFQPAEQPEHTTDLPVNTANPRRTTLIEVPVAAAVAAE